MRYNILFLCSYYPNRLRNGGSFIERHALAVSEFADVSVLTLEPDNLDNNMPYELIYSLEHNEKLNVVRAYYNLKCVNIPVIRSIIRFYRFILAAYLGYKLLKTKTGKAQIVHLNVVRPLGIFALFLTYFEHLPLVLTEHSTAYLDENKGGMTYFETLLTRWVLKKAKYITPVSLLLKNAIKNKFKIADSKFKVVSNVVSSDIFYYQQSPKREGKLKFLHISNMKPFKNVEGIISVMHRLKQIRQDFELHIIGDGDALPSLKLLAQQLDLLDNTVFFHPQKTEKDIVQEMHKMDCFILFSHYETASMVVMESLCCGLPVIGTRVGVVPEVIQDGKNGILIPPNDKNALFEACLTMLDEGHKFKDAANFKNYSTLFSGTHIGQQYNEVYKEILSL